MKFNPKHELIDFNLSKVSHGSTLMKFTTRSEPSNARDTLSLPGIEIQGLITEEGDIIITEEKIFYLTKEKKRR